MSVVKETAKCPYCKETIAVGAVKCRHCFSELTVKKDSFFKKYNNFRLGFLSGVVFSIIIGILLYIQFFVE